MGGMDPRQLAEEVAGAANGERDALQALIVYYHAKLGRAVAAERDETLRRHVELEDVLQQAYLSAFGNAAGTAFEGPGHFYNWLRKIAIARLRDAERAARRKRRDVTRQVTNPPGASNSYPNLLGRLAARQSTPSRRMKRDEAVAAVMSSLARLKEDQREVVRLRFLEDVPVAEIARRLGKTDTAVYTLCHRGLKALRERMSSITRYLTRL